MVDCCGYERSSQFAAKYCRDVVADSLSFPVQVARYVPRRGTNVFIQCSEDFQNDWKFQERRCIRELYLMTSRPYRKRYKRYRWEILSSMSKGICTAEQAHGNGVTLNWPGLTDTSGLAVALRPEALIRTCSPPGSSGGQPLS